MRCVRYQVYHFSSRVYITGCIITTGCSIAVGLLIDTWNIGWNCLGGGIQYLLPTMIEPPPGGGGSLAQGQWMGGAVVTRRGGEG